MGWLVTPLGLGLIIEEDKPTEFSCYIYMYIGNLPPSYIALLIFQPLKLMTLWYMWGYVWWGGGRVFGVWDGGEGGGWVYLSY
jgi:hypothetical protein